jgi:hypothetical protein
MAIMTEFINLIVPRIIIEQKYPGGWAQWLEAHAELIGGRVCYDDHLFHDGAMNPMDIGTIVESWTAMGFECVDEKDGQKYWTEACVYEPIFGSATLPCDWIETDKTNRFVSLKGAPVCELAGPDR